MMWAYVDCTLSFLNSDTLPLTVTQF